VRALLVALSLLGCASYQSRQAAERPPCRDVALAVLLAECKDAVATAPNATEKARVRKECLARVDTWESCR
jgi:hypothetical protein